MATHDSPEQAAARARLDALAAARKATEKNLTDLQEQSKQAVIEILFAKTLRPADVARHIEYDRQHVSRLARAAGVPPLREATVQAKTKTAEPEDPDPEPETPPQPTVEATPEPDPEPITEEQPTATETEGAPAAEVAPEADEVQAIKPDPRPTWLRRHPEIAALTSNEAITAVGKLTERRPVWFGEMRKSFTGEPKLVHYAMLVADAEDPEPPTPAE